MKKILLLLVVVSLISVASADGAKKANRKPASQVTGFAQYSGPISINGVVPKGSGSGPLIISGDVAEKIYEQMTAVTPSTDPGSAKVGRGILCKKNQDAEAKVFCTIDFSDIANGVVEDGNYRWTPLPNDSAGCWAPAPKDASSVWTASPKDSDTGLVWVTPKQ